MGDRSKPMKLPYDWGIGQIHSPSKNSEFLQVPKFYWVPGFPCSCCRLGDENISDLSQRSQDLADPAQELAGAAPVADELRGLFSKHGMRQLMGYPLHKNWGYPAW